MKKVLIIILLALIILPNYLNICCAVTITEAQLEASIKKYLEENTDGNTNLVLNKNKKEIVISAKDTETNEEIVLKTNYNLSSKPVFTTNLSLKSNMSKEEIQEECVNSLAGAIVMFELIANSLGFEVTGNYILSKFFGYLLVPDVLVTVCTNSQTISDDLFTLNYKTISKTDQEHTIQSIFTVDTDADFSIIESKLPNNNDPITDINNGLIIDDAKDALDKFEENKNNQNNQNNPNSTNTNTNKNKKPIKEVLIIPPSKTYYKKGEKFDTTGLKITVVYIDDSVEDVTTGYVIQGYNSVKEGKQTIKISYNGFVRTFNIRVGKASNSNVNDMEKLPQTGNFFDLKDTLYLLIFISSCVLLFIIAKSNKYNKKQN